MVMKCHQHRPNPFLQLCHPHLQCSIPQPIVFKCPWGIYWTPNSSWSCILGVGTQMTGYFSLLKGKHGNRWMQICNLKRFGKDLNVIFFFIDIISSSICPGGMRSRSSCHQCSLEGASCLSFPEKSIKEEHRLVEHICSLYFISTRL